MNALPESAVVTINSRIDLYSNGETTFPDKPLANLRSCSSTIVDEVSQAYISIIKQIGKTYGLSVNGEGVKGACALLGNITLTVDQPGAPSPITPTDSVAFEVFARAVQAACGQGVVTAPSSMTGNTDTRHYVSFIFRDWNPLRRIN